MWHYSAPRSARILISWGPITSTVFRITFNKELWAKVAAWLTHFRSIPSLEALEGKGAVTPSQCKEIEALCRQVAGEANKSALPVKSARALRSKE
mmetsp:Transcript_21924/g.55401  ORF Transcript_21924/g.55401 Transcript_21924/m.55401 type:complete len:95 (+) Transcript_21924:1881-2165(+)